MNKTLELAIKPAEVEILAKNLQILLSKRGVSENDIAQSLNIPVMTVRRIVSGETGDPRVSTLKLIASYFDVSIDALLEDNDQKSLYFMSKKKPQFIPILDWKTAGNITSIKDIHLNNWNQWYPIVRGDGSLLHENTFALESRPSMQPRFPWGTLFIIDPDEAPTDGDIILVKMKSSGDISLRELMIDPPKWLLQSVVAGSETLFYEPNCHQIVGVVILNLLQRKNG